MAAKILEAEVKKMLIHIEQEENFILTGGAGSGKTYSLISLIEEIGNKYPFKTITCITYTNNAVAEIRSRITNDNLRVSTIHEFIWSIISKYQTEIKETIVELVNSDEEKKFKRPKEFNDLQVMDIGYLNNSNIIYDEYYSLSEHKDSKVSHDHILIIAERMFNKYTKLCDILKDISDFIFVDEYQDTDPLIIDILLTHLTKSSKKNIIGFFGDSMQAIYDTGVGTITDSSPVRINKKQNRRNPSTIIDLANKLRIDGIEQIPSTDINAPNMKNGEIIQGDIKFVYGDDIESLSAIRGSKVFKDWDYNNSKKTKELWLVHKANAKMAGFEDLYELYNSDAIIELITRISKKVREENIDTGSFSFESLASNVKISVRNRGDLFENLKRNPKYNSGFEWIKDKKWEEIQNFRINKDSLLSYKFNGLKATYEANSKRDSILIFLDSIYELVELYKNRKYNDFLKKTGLKISSLEEKIIIKEAMDKLSNKNFSIEEVVTEVNRILKIKEDSFEDFINGKGSYLWQRIKDISFNEYTNSIEYQKEFFPFATQHSIKGSEYDNVLVVLDNGNWNKYNFEKLFKNFSSTDSVVNRTKKLFYVCCTRARKNLVIFMPTLDSIIVDKAIDLLGKENVYHSKVLIDLT